MVIIIVCRQPSVTGPTLCKDSHSYWYACNISKWLTFERLFAKLFCCCIDVYSFFSWAAKPCNTTGSFSSLILLLTDTVIQYCRCVPASGTCRSSPLIVASSLVLSHFWARTLPKWGKHVAPPGHILFSCRAQNLPFSMTVRIKCPSAFGDRHRSKIEGGYHRGTRICHHGVTTFI